MAGTIYLEKDNRSGKLDRGAVTSCRHRQRETRYLGEEARVEFCLKCNARRFTYLKGMTKLKKVWVLPRAVVDPFLPAL
jgi:hypothetical protein